MILNAAAGFQKSFLQLDFNKNYHIYEFGINKIFMIFMFLGINS